MKSLVLCAATLASAAGLLSAAPVIEINQQSTTVSAVGGAAVTFTEGTLVPFDHPVSSTYSTGGPGFVYSASAVGRLQITLQGWHLAGTSTGTAEADGEFIPANAAGYGSTFDFAITIPLEDAPYGFTFSGTTFASGEDVGNSASLLFFEEGLSGAPIAFYGAGNSVAPTVGGTVSGLFMPGKSYFLSGGDSIYHGQGASTESGGYTFDLQIVPEPSAAVFLGLGAMASLAFRRKRANLG